jgi:predicted ATPase with chaperone activity
MNYYHDEQMVALFEELKQPKTLEELQLSETFVKDLLLKLIYSYGTIKTVTINEVTGLHWDIIETVLRKLENDEFCGQIGGSFLFSSVEYTITQKGKELAARIMAENPYVGLAPVSYENYDRMMDIQLSDRFPLSIPDEVVERTFDGVVGLEEAKATLIESATIDKGIFIYGAPGAGKTFITSKTAELLPPIIIPKFIEFGGKILQLFDNDFHNMTPEQPEDPRWVKVYAPFVFTGAELNLKKLDSAYNPKKGVYETSPTIKANGGVLLVDDLGRQQESHELILNRLIVPMENKKDVVYIRGVPVIVYTEFIPAFSTNLDVSIMDEAHLRRAPLHIFLGNPAVENVAEVFRRNLDALGEKYGEIIVERLRRVYMPISEGGEGLSPSYAHARDLAQICQAARILHGEDHITPEVMEEALGKHVLIALQRMGIDISQVQRMARTFRIYTTDKEKVILQLFSEASAMCSEEDAVLVDLDDTISAAKLGEMLREVEVPFSRIDVVGETERELKRTIMDYSE